MWLIIFMAICVVPLIVVGLICIWRNYQWDKYCEENDTGANA